MNLEQVWHKSIQKCKQSISDPLKRSAYELIELQTSIQIIDSTICFICKNHYIENLIFEYVPSLYFEISKLLDIKNFGINILSEESAQNTLHTFPPKLGAILGNINPEKTFENFVLEPKNALVYEIALKIAKNPGTNDCNPFFLYGSSGIGKTHLLWAIANKIRATRPDQIVRYIRGEEFIRLYVEYLSKSESQEHHPRFEDYISKYAVLIIDDILSITKGKKSREIFIEIITDYIDKTNKQLIVASTEAPCNLKALPSKQSSILCSGLCSELFPPSADSRVAITILKCKELGIHGK